MQVEVTGGRLLISSEERGSPAAALQRRRDLMSVFDVRAVVLPPLMRFGITSVINTSPH